MAKLPAILFFPKDWLADPVATCSLDAQGLWLRMMILMHFSERYGYLVLNGVTMPPEDVARRCGSTLDQYTSLLIELDRAGVPSRTTDGVIYSRRMVRDAKKRKDAQRGGRLGGNPKLGVNYNRPGYIYVCQRRDGCVKIGISAEPAKRISKLRASERDHSIFLICQMRVMDMGGEEASLHGEYQSHKVEGEWFRLNAQQIKDLQQKFALKAKPKANHVNGNGFGISGNGEGSREGEMSGPAQAAYARSIARANAKGERS